VAQDAGSEEKLEQQIEQINTALNFLDRPKPRGCASPRLFPSRNESFCRAICRQSGTLRPYRDTAGNQGEVSFLQCKRSRPRRMLGRIANVSRYPSTSVTVRFAAYLRLRRNIVSRHPAMDRSARRHEGIRAVSTPTFISNCRAVQTVEDPAWISPVALCVTNSPVVSDAVW